MDVDWLRSSSFISLSVRRALLLQHQKVNFEWFLYGCYYRNGRHQFLLKTLYFSKRFYCENTVQKILYIYTHTHTINFIRYSCYTGQYSVAINNAKSSQFFSWTVCLSFSSDFYYCCLWPALFSQTVRLFDDMMYELTSQARELSSQNLEIQSTLRNILQVSQVY